ncbi:MAG: antibiotic biosynthesis monooxygenase [Hyphomonas sp.]|nr:antibiotic biosynthesis monooxygenase [Hyphomonas sp.]
MIIVTGAVTMTEATRARMLEISLEHCQRSRTEPGCLDHRVHEDCERPGRLLFVEHWADMPALLAHFAVKASRDFARELGELSATPADIHIYSAEDLPFPPPR